MKYRMYLLVPVIMIGLFCFQHCDDIFEEDIGNDTVYVLAPPDSLVSGNYTHTFWWEAVEGAEFYNLTIVSPSFDYVNRLLLDTVIGDTRFQATLSPGNYEWSVNATNYSSSTAYTVYTLIIEETQDLKDEQVVLQAPKDNHATNSRGVLFQWYLLDKAETYKFEIKKNDWDGQRVINPHITSHDTVRLQLDEGKYAWGVQMQNETSKSGFTIRTLHVDFTAPETASLTSPADDEEISEVPVTLRWRWGDDTGSPLFDSVFISNDSVFSTSGIIESAFVNEAEYNMATEDVGKYFWKVKTIDKAGNKSNFSNVRKFHIKNEK